VLHHARLKKRKRIENICCALETLRYSNDMTNNTISTDSSTTSDLGWHYAPLDISKIHPERMAQFALTEICRDRAMRVSARHWPDMVLISFVEACAWLKASGMEDNDEINHILENLEIDGLISPL
jgi:hypothetical protein